MWDAIKKNLGTFARQATSLTRHSLAIEGLMISPTIDFGLRALRDYVMGIETEEEFRLFGQAVEQHMLVAQQAMVRAQSNPNSGWGNQYEDQISYGMAHLAAGVSPGSRETAAAARRLQGLQLIQQYAPGFWAEACAQRRAGRSGPDGAMAHSAFSQQSPATTAQPVTPPAAAAGPWEAGDLATIVEKASVDMSAFELLQRLGQGELSEEILGQIDACSQAYSRMLGTMGGGLPGLTRSDVARSLMQVSEQAGNLCERLARKLPDHAGDGFARWLEEAAARFEQARSAALECGDSASAQRLEEKVKGVALDGSRNLDAELLALQQEQQSGEPSLEEPDRLVRLAWIKWRVADSFGALEDAEAAERMLQSDLGLKPASDEALTSQIAAAMAALEHGTPDWVGVERAVKVRHLFKQVYDLLAAVHESHGDEKADDYIRLAEALAGEPEKALFGEEMQARMQGLMSPFGSIRR